MIYGPEVGAISTWLASLGITSALAVAAAWALFKWLGSKWVEDHFAKELEAFKAEKQAALEKLRTEYGRETERLKADLNRFADRATRFHDREYEVLPEAWGLMNKAFGAASNAISSFQQHPDLDAMGPDQFESWLEQSGLEKYQCEELRGARNKNEQYMTLRNWRQIADAERACMEFTNYVVLQGVFIDEDLSSKMIAAAQDMRKALINRSMVERVKGHTAGPGQTDFWSEAVEELQKVEPVVLDVKNEVRQRLTDIRLAPDAEGAQRS